MSETNISVEFIITGDNFQYGNITEVLKIKPDDYYSKGDKSSNRDILRKETCWLISTGYENSLDINIQFQKIINPILNKEKELIELKKKYQLEYLFSIAINIEKEQTPAVYFETSIIRFVSKIGAEIDIDISVLS